MVRLTHAQTVLATRRQLQFLATPLNALLARAAELLPLYACALTWRNLQNLYTNMYNNNMLSVHIIIPHKRDPHLNS